MLSHFLGGSTLTEQQLQDCLAIAKERANLVNEMINVAVGSTKR